MKKSIFLLIALFTLMTGNIKALDASVSYASFKSTEFSFIEVYLNILGTTVEYSTTDSIMYQASVEVLILIKQDTSIVQHDKYILSGPITKFTNDFMDVRRFPLPDGEYVLEVILIDVNKPENRAAYEKSFIVNYRDKGLLQSDIQLVGKYHEETSNSLFVKNGLFLEPLPYNFYYKDATHLYFYQELYNSDKVLNDLFLMRYTIERLNGNGKTEAVMIGNKKLSPKSVNVALVKKDITKLPSGNYQLVVKILNREGELLSSKSIPFQRSNPYFEEEILASADLGKEFVADMDKQTLRYSLKAIAPIVYDNNVEVLNLVIGGNDVVAQRRYLFSFWGRINPNNPKEAYDKYMEAARAVDKKYNSGFGYGFESDRGYTFLKYGKPTDIVTVEDEPTAPPYEIWIYDEVNTTPRQGNVKFLFYNPSLAGGNFQLLHSTCIGELNNPQWEVTLYNNDTDSMNRTDFDSKTVTDGYNRRAREYFNDF